MEAHDILARMGNIADAEERRLNKLLDGMRQLLQQSDEWSDAHARLFDTLAGEVKRTSIVRWVSVVASVVLLLALAATFIWSWQAHDRLDRAADFVDLVSRANLPLRFDPSQGHGLAVLVDTTAFSHHGVTRDAVSTINAISRDVPALGRHYGLGPNEQLSVARIEKTKCWQIMPSNGDKNQPLGLLQLSDRCGRIRSPGSRVAVGDTLWFDDLPELCMKLEGWKPVEDTTDTVIWIVKFGAKSSDKTISWSETEFHVDQSPNALRYCEPRLVDGPDWDSVFVISTAIGRFGEDRDGAYTWYIRSCARQIKPGSV